MFSIRNKYSFLTVKICKGKTKHGDSLVGLTPVVNRIEDLVLNLLLDNFSLNLLAFLQFRS